ncbi:MAG TPA: membrane protein insertase YidC [Candidatus Azoamicus sp. OHIO2]
METDLISAKINLKGGNISTLSLKKYPKNLKEPIGINIFTKTDKQAYFATSEFLNSDINNNESRIYYTNKKNYLLKTFDSHLIINLKHNLNNGFIINKIYIFKNYSYEIEVNFYISNITDKILFGRIFGCITKQYNKIKTSWFTSQNYEGTAIYTEKKMCRKISLDKIEKKDIIEIIVGGWLAHIDNHFITAWIPTSNNNYMYSATKNINFYNLKYINETELYIFPGECKYVHSTLFVGPKIKNYLHKLHKGLDLTIDYGIFWPIAISIFLLLSKIHTIINNWGIAIIITTILIKLLFFQLSTISYKSLGHMKKLQPRLDILKERYKENKKEYSQAILEMYKNEKVNPLSGCLPILIQIPVFISLYYVLLESVELRHAPFILWINDLSAKDSYYILPIIMCLTMFIQQKLNPPIQDPFQQKIMLFMPFIFLLIFLQFPAGLVLYWVINNILSILQQWIITKTV